MKKIILLLTIILSATLMFAQNNGKGKGNGKIKIEKEIKEKGSQAKENIERKLRTLILKKR